MNTGINYSTLQSKKKLQPIAQSSQQQQQLISNIQNQQATQQNQQNYTSLSQSNVYTQISGVAGTANNTGVQNQVNNPPFLNSYYFGSVMNSNYSANQHQLQHQISQNHQNNSKQLASTNSPKSFFGQSNNSLTNNSGYLENSLNISKQKATMNNANGSNHSTQTQQQLQQQQQQQYQQASTSLLTNTPQQISQQLSPVSQSPALHSQNHSSAEIIYSPNSMKNKKLYIDTNSNFYFSQSNASQISNLKLGGNLSTQSSQSNTSSKGFNNLRKNQQKTQRSPILQSQQTPSMISQSSHTILSNNSPSTTANSSGLSYLNNSGTLNSNNLGQNGSFNLNMSTNSLNSSNSQNMGVPYSDESRFIKKTQHFVKGLTSQSGTWNGNNQEEIDDLDESVIEMMKEHSLYEQAQKGIIPDADPTKFSVKRNGIVSCYAAKTHQGLVRNYNEDRVSIILNIMKPQNRHSEEQWPKCSFFGVYDGHGGVNCADFLRDHLHQYVIKDQNFPWNPKEAIKNGFEQAEIQFLKQAQSQINRGGQIDRSGSCALVVLIVGDTCYVANVGDSRAVMSQDSGKNIYALTRDHKPMDEVENQRIHDNGGKVYQTKIQQIATTDRKTEEPQTIVGPYRVLPGRLSVTRTFGDIEAKFPRYGGNPKVVISTPEIKSFKIQQNHDFIIIGCDGIYDKITSQEIGQIVWDTSKNENLGDNVHEFAGKSVENIMKLSISRKTLDNITVVMIGFDNLERMLFDKTQASADLQSTQNVPTSNDTTQTLTTPLSSAIPPNTPKTHNLTTKSQKILQNISQAANTISQTTLLGLNSKNSGLSQSVLMDKKLTVASQNILPLEKTNKAGNIVDLTNNLSAPLGEKDSNLENIEQKSTQQSYFGFGGTRLPLSNQQKKRVTENSQEDISQTSSLKQFNPLNRTGNISRTIKVGMEYQNTQQGVNSISPLYSSQQFPTNKLKQSNLMNPTHGQVQSKGLQTLNSASETKFRSSLIKNISTK